MVKAMSYPVWLLIASPGVLISLSLIPLLELPASTVLTSVRFVVNRS